jgi:hypothetical protein
MAVGNSYFDMNNYTQPASIYLDGQFFWDMMPGFRKKTDIFVKRNSAELSDDFIQLGQNKEIEFYQIENYREQTELEGSDLQFASVYISYDPYHDEYNRKVYSVGDLLGQVGGIYEFMLVSGMLLVSIFSERLFVSAILNKIYQIDKARDEEIKAMKNKNKTTPAGIKIGARRFDGKIFL